MFLVLCSSCRVLNRNTAFSMHGMMLYCMYVKHCSGNSEHRKKCLSNTYATQVLLPANVKRFFLSLIEDVATEGELAGHMGQWRTSGWNSIWVMHAILPFYSHFNFLSQWDGRQYRRTSDRLEFNLSNTSPYIVVILSFYFFTSAPYSLMWLSRQEKK